eukprot:5271305-Amphidinium_carterae.1
MASFRYQTRSMSTSQYGWNDGKSSSRCQPQRQIQAAKLKRCLHVAASQPAANESYVYEH